MDAADLAALERELRAMDEAAQALERIALEECNAARTLDAEALIRLAEERGEATRALNEAFERCLALLARQGLDPEHPLEMLIAGLPEPAKARLGAARRALRERIERAASRSRESRMRLHAAREVTASLLRHLGLEAQETTYAPGGGR